MIKSKKDYFEYLHADRIALGIDKNKISELIFPNPCWKFQKLLRKVEYYKNCKHGIVVYFYYYFLKYKFRKLSITLGFSIPLNVFGPGLAIVHYGTIIVSNRARIGKNCRLHACTNIGASGGNDLAPKIGDNVYIGPGAIIYGDIQIGNNIAISANSTVNKSFEENNILLAGTPARKIKEINISDIIKQVQLN